MVILIYAILSIILGMLLHVFFWKLFRFRSKVALLSFFLFSPIVVIGVGVFFNFELVFWSDRILVIGCSILIGLAYVITTPAFESSSPTMSILLLIRSSIDGCSRNDLLNCIGDDDFILHRLDELQRGGFVARSKNNKYTLTSDGKKYLMFFTFYSRLSGFNKVGG